MVNFGERFLFRNAQKSLESILGLKNLEQIHGITQVELPREIFDKAKADLHLTLADGRERLTIFDVVEGQIRPIREEVGLPLDFVNGDFRASVGETGWLRSFYERFLARPIPLRLHTHPILSENYLDERGIQTAFKGLALKQYIAMNNEGSNFFSPGDLLEMETDARYIRAHLLASNGGYTWVINPNPHTKLSFTHRASSQYKRDSNEILLSAGEAMLEAGNANIDSYEVYRSLLGKLYDFCNKNGFVGFYNRDKNSPKLTTLRGLPF